MLLAFGHSQSQRDVFVVQIELQGLDNATLDFLHLFQCQLVVSDDLDGRELGDSGVHVFHAGGYAAELLWHTVAHRHPLKFKLLLGEFLSFVFRDSVGVVLAQGSRNDVHFLGFRHRAEIVP